MHSASSGYSSDWFFQLQLLPIAQHHSSWGLFSHEYLLHPTICAIRLWHAAVPAAAGMPLRWCSARASCPQNVSPANSPCPLSASLPPSWGFCQCPAQLEVVEGEFFSLWGNVNWQQRCSAGVVCEMDGWDQRWRRRFYVCVLCISGYLQCAFRGCCLKQEPVAEAPELLLPPAHAQGAGLTAGAAAGCSAQACPMQFPRTVTALAVGSGANQLHQQSLCPS